MSTLEQDIEKVVDDMEAVVARIAKERKNVSFHTSYADGSWEVSVDENARVTNGGYAEEHHGEHRQLGDLAPWELARLIQSAL
jgi:hypothetical protein